MGVERIRSASIAVLLPVLAGAQSPRPILERTVEVHARQVRLADAMTLVAHDAGFKRFGVVAFAVNVRTFAAEWSVDRGCPLGDVAGQVIEAVTVRQVPAR